MDQSGLRVTPVPTLDALPPYLLGRPDTGIDVVLDFNECLAANAGFTGAATELDLNRYPDSRPLEVAIARRIGVEPERVLATGGADDALERAVRSVCCPGRSAVVTRPSYGMIRRFVRAAGAKLTEVEWWRGDLPEDELCEAASGASLVALVSPNNPTGAVASRETFSKLAERFPQTLIVLDQAYLDFTGPEHDLTDIALANPNVVLVRTLSKAWGAAGIRVGFAVGNPTVVDWMRRIGMPFPVATPSAALATAVIEAGGPDRSRIRRIVTERARLTELLVELGAEPLPSEGSFVFASFPNAAFVWRGLASLGIAVRAFADRPEVDGWLRITLPGDEEVFARLCEALRTVLEPEALLFDLDGVLADVSNSYREAIRRTAAFFGVELSANDIARAKAAGDANNDWRLTQRLLGERGVAVPLEDVTSRFEALYQGTPDQPGLRRSETLLVDAKALRGLSQRYPLGVVTGRPRADAERFLDDRFIGRLFTVVVAMEDAPAKPDPGPVRLALDRLGVRRAWLVGDTPDDMRSARAAGVVPLGVCASGDDPVTAATALREAGAAAILDSATSLPEVLS